MHKFQVPSSHKPSCPAVSCVPGLSHFKKKKGSDPTFEARLFQVDVITGEDVSSLETRFEAGVDEQAGLCVFSSRFRRRAVVTTGEPEWAIILHATCSSTSSGA